MKISQNEQNKITPIIENDTKALLCTKFNKKGYKLIEVLKGKKIYGVPIIIDSSFGGDYYKFKIIKNFGNLNKDIVYKAHYKLIKFYTEDVWNKLSK